MKELKKLLKFNNNFYLQGDRLQLQTITLSVIAAKQLIK